MGELNRLIEEMFHDQRERTHTTMMCRIESYDFVNMRADITPLVKEYHDTTGESDFEWVELDTIQNAKVACLRAGERHLIRPPYKPGDVVLAVCAERSIDKVIETGEPSEQVGRRRHSYQDALVIAGITIVPDPMPDEHGADLLMCKTEPRSQRILTRIVLVDEVDQITIAKGDSDGYNYDAFIKIYDDKNIQIFSQENVYIHAWKNIHAYALQDVIAHAGRDLIGYADNDAKVRAENDMVAYADNNLQAKGVANVLVKSDGRVRIEAPLIEFQAAEVKCPGCSGPAEGTEDVPPPPRPVWPY